MPSDTVAPRAGAWIETQAQALTIPHWLVAPRAGAWIETWSVAISEIGMLCRRHRKSGCPPRSGCSYIRNRNVMSPPARGRGLKHKAATPQPSLSARFLVFCPSSRTDCRCASVSAVFASMVLVVIMFPTCLEMSVPRRYAALASSGSSRVRSEGFSSTADRGLSLV